MWAPVKSWVDVPKDSHFPLQNLPYGVFSTKANPDRRVGIAIGDKIFDLAAVSAAGLFTGPHLRGKDCFLQVGSGGWDELIQRRSLKLARSHHTSGRNTPSLPPERP